MPLLRKWVESALKASGLFIAQAKQANFTKEGFDISELPVRKNKAAPGFRDTSDLDFIVGHVTDVAGGFGVSKRRVKYWEDRIRGVSEGVAKTTGYPLIDRELGRCRAWTRLIGTQTFVYSGPLREIAERLALWERFRGTVPYHQIAARNGDNIKNRGLGRRTYHAGLGNFGAGWAVDVGHDEELTSWMIETGRAALISLVRRIIRTSARARRNGVKYAPHRCFSASRRNDTAVRVHREIVLPTVSYLPELEVDYTIHMGRGRPIPKVWDDAALYDSRGRRVRS